MQKATLLIALLSLAGCATQPPIHIVESDTSKSDGLATGANSSQFSLTTGVRDFHASTASKDGDVGETSGAATRRSILCGLVEWGDNGAGTAAQKAGIKKVKTVQNGGTDVFWGLVYSEQQTIVTGTTNEVATSGVSTHSSTPKKSEDKAASSFGEPTPDKPGRLVLVNPQDPSEVLISTRPVSAGAN
jgi:hypothetical protein